MAIQNTPNQGFRYPDMNEKRSSVPTHIQNLAEDVEKRVVMVFATTNERNTKVPSPTAGMMCFVTGSTALFVHDGNSWRQVWPHIPAITSGAGAPTAAGSTGDVYFQYGA